MIIRVRDESGNFIKIPLGYVSSKEVTEIIEAYFTENPIEVPEVDLREYAKKSATLSGYGITDAYTKEETDTKFLNKGLFIEEKANLVTSDMLNIAVRDMNASVSKKLEETVLYEDVVNTPEWAKQPACEGTLDSAFNTDDFYYVTLKDTDGNLLPDGQFMLKDFYTEDATLYSTVFTLPALNTGDDTLVENYPVEFVSVGTGFKLRDAGVWEAAYKPADWKLTGNCGQLRLVCDGEFIQRTAGAYFITCATTDKKVSHYHSVDSTAFHSDSTSQIVPYVALSSVASYKSNQFRDEMRLERLSDQRYLTERKSMIRCMAYGGTAFKVVSGNVIGHGEILNGDTVLTKINIQVASNKERGFIRNGSVIRVTEVK